MQQARGSFRKFVLDHQLDVADAARFMAMVSGDLCRRAHRLLRCEVPLHVLEADHRDPRRRHGRQRRDDGDPAWSSAACRDAEPPRVPERALMRHAGRRARHRAIPGTPKIDFTSPALTGLGDRHFARASDLEYEVGERPHLGWHPLPLGGRGRRRDRQEDRPRRARAPLPAVERLGGFEGRSVRGPSFTSRRADAERPRDGPSSGGSPSYAAARRETR